MSNRFTLAVESILRSLDRKDGLELPPSNISLDFLNDAVVFGDNGPILEEKIDDSQRSEMFPYANNFCYALELHGVKTVDEALEIFEKFTTMREDETPEKFIERCKNLPEYAWLNEAGRISIHMLTTIHRRSLKIFEILVAKYFSKVESSHEN